MEKPLDINNPKYSKYKEFVEENNLKDATLTFDTHRRENVLTFQLEQHDPIQIWRAALIQLKTTLEHSRLQVRNQRITIKILRNNGK